MFFLPNVDQFTAAPGRNWRRSQAIGTGLLFAGLLVAAGCGKPTVVTPPAAPAAPAEPTAESIERPTGPVWESQTQETLPAPQPIPAAAAPLDLPPLRIDRTESPLDETAQPPLDVEQPAVGRGEVGGDEPPETGTPFRLGQILTDQERRTYNRMIDRDLVAAEESLARVLRGGGLQERSTQVRRVRAFITQAKEVRDDDLPLAQNLAGRARLLAQDLAGNTPDR